MTAVSLPAGVPVAGLVAAAVIGLLFLRGRHMKVAAAVLVLVAGVAGLRPGGGGGPDAPVPVAYRPWIVRAGGLCPQISPALLAAQLRQESGFNPNARSSAGAQGIAQFMPGTWRSWATDADGNGVASPWEPADAITAQGRLMCALADRYDGRTDLALAAYNAGPGAVDAAGAVPAIAETRNYVNAITASVAGFTGL
ncbi:lytic transglycosylase domain-containing protein [Frankia sp. CiP3]|uniref:lytic transglycosylase domain-containing protein n=1 Tax=Frankia sp. CiP3 TaxID=2880971 RepID=UPI001EF437C2|nr:lytic transglycosylase domain-containing protein [Frankia sp. CiP3]